MSEGPVLGIDLGTTNSVVAVADGGQSRVLVDPDGRRMVPSVVSFHADGRTLVGYEAREQRLVDAANTVYAVKRLIGRPFDSPEVARARERFAFEIVANKHGGSVVKVRRGTYALAEISAMVLRELRRLAEAVLEEPCERAVITVPANFNELQRSATKAAGKVAGLDVLRILNEPTAAALAYGYGQGQGSEKVAVYDLGGGTFDITILELDDDVFEVLATAGDTFLGGEDIDRAIGEAMSDVFQAQHGVDPRSDHQAFERLKAAGEWVKCQLSSEDSVEVTIEELARGKGGAGLDLTYSMTRGGLEDLARSWLDRSFAVCDEALSNAGLKVADVDSVVLVGGSTRMPMCRRMVESYFGKTPRTDIDADLVVAQGAGIHGHALGGPRTPKAVPPQRKSAPLGRVALKRVTRTGIDDKHQARKKKATMVGMPRQPAFAPPEIPIGREPAPRPRRPTNPPPLVPDLPPPSRPPGPDARPDTPPDVVPSRVVAVKTPKTTLDLELDGLSPPDDDIDSLDDLAPPSDAPDALDDLAPPAFDSTADPFADLAPDDPFAVPKPGGHSHAGPLPAPRSGLDVPFGIEDVPLPPKKGPPPPPLDALPAPGQKPVPSREPTTPFVLERHAPPPPPPPPRAAEPETPFFVDVEEEGFAPSGPEAAAPDLPLPPRAQPVVAMPEGPPPILMDVTPHSLGIETAGGFMRRLIAKNAPVPTEQTRSFTTAQDDQREVAVRICQGEEDAFDHNEVLGEVVLDELPARARGSLSIEVTFILDADGTLAVEARDPESGRGQKTHINLRGGHSDDDIVAMRLRLESEALET